MAVEVTVILRFEDVVPDDTEIERVLDCIVIEREEEEV